jgi:hypothetical protein
MANRTSFGIDLEQTQGIVLGSLMAFQQSVQAFQGITEPDLTKKAILILQRYITSIKNFNSLSDARKEFFSSKQFVNTFTEQLVNLVSVEAPETYFQFQQQLKDESKSSITQFLDTIFLKSYGPKGGNSWRGGLDKTLYSRGTLCTNVQPIGQVPVANPDNPSDAELQAYTQGLEPDIKAVNRQGAAPSQLINYSFSGGAPGFTLPGTCYLCGLPIVPVTPRGSGNTNCEHIMPILSALQKWDFIYRYEVLEPIRNIKTKLAAGTVFGQLDTSEQFHIKRLFEISDEFAWSHWCCNMLKLDLDFLHLNNNGRYVPHYHNINTFLTWLSNPGNIFDCDFVLRGINLPTARASIMSRIKRLCRVLNMRNIAGNARVDNNRNTNLNLIKVYGIFLLLQYVTVTSFSKLISIQGQTGLGIVGSRSGGNLDGIAKEPITPPTRRKKFGPFENRMLPWPNEVALEPVTPPTRVSSFNKKVVPLRIQPTRLQQEKKRLQTEVGKTLRDRAAVERAAAAEAAAAAAAAVAAAVAQQPAIQILKTHFYQAIPYILTIEQIKTRLQEVAGDIDTSTALLNNENDFNTMVGLLLNSATWTAMINSITQHSGVSTIISTENIQSICLGWFRDMVYDYVNIKLMITIKTQNLSQEPATRDPAIDQALHNDIFCLQAMSSDITTLQEMISQAHSQIYLPLVRGLTTSVGTWSHTVDNIDNVDNVIFSIEQLVGMGGFTLTEEIDDTERSQAVDLPQQIQAQVPLILPRLTSSIPNITQNINRQISEISQTQLITDAIRYLTDAIRYLTPTIPAEQLSIHNLQQNVATLDMCIRVLQSRHNDLVIANTQSAYAATTPQIQQEIQQTALYGNDLIKLRELLLLSQNLTQLPGNLTQLMANITRLPQNVGLIKSTLIDPLVTFQTYLTSSFTDFVSSLIPDITPTATDTATDTAAAAEGGGKRNHKRKSGGYRKTIRRNHKRIIRVAKGGAATYRKKHNKSRKHKTKKRKIRKHKTRKHKTGKYKRL